MPVAKTTSPKVSPRAPYARPGVTGAVFQHQDGGFAREARRGDQGGHASLPVVMSDGWRREGSGRGILGSEVGVDDGVVVDAPADARQAVALHHAVDGDRGLSCVDEAVTGERDAGLTRQVEGDPGRGDRDVPRGSGIRARGSRGVRGARRDAWSRRTDPEHTRLHGAVGKLSHRGGVARIAPRSSEPRHREHRQQDHGHSGHDQQRAFAAHESTPGASSTAPSTTVGMPERTVQRISPGSSRPRYGEFLLRPRRSPSPNMRAGRGS